jgi:hypothetical protein
MKKRDKKLKLKKQQKNTRQEESEPDSWQPKPSPEQTLEQDFLSFADVKDFTPKPTELAVKQNQSDKFPWLSK